MIYRVWKEKKNYVTTVTTDWGKDEIRRHVSWRNNIKVEKGGVCRVGQDWLITELERGKTIEWINKIKRVMERTNSKSQSISFPNPVAVTWV